jgi:hypothetical protein
MIQLTARRKDHFFLEQVDITTFYKGMFTQNINIQININYYAAGLTVIISFPNVITYGFNK